MSRGVAAIVVTTALLCLVINHGVNRQLGAMAQPRPALPRFTYIPYGQMVCRGTSEECAGPDSGIFRGWYEFDEKGVFLNYRQDSIVGDDNNTIVYIRQYISITQGSLYYLANDTTSSLQCLAFNSSVSFTRNWLQGAKYEGIRDVDGNRCYTFTSDWKVDGKQVEVTTWVREIEQDKIYGLSSGVVSYYFGSYQFMNGGFHNPVFVQPSGLSCYNWTATALKKNTRSSLSWAKSFRLKN